VVSTETLQDERETVHIADDTRRICMLETLTLSGGSAPNPITPRYRFQLDNHLGTCCVECDESGSVISFEEYHPYGTSAYRAWKTGVEVSAKRYRYNGKERDEETSLYYYGARYYAPWLGRWTAADPAGPVDGHGLYNYVRGSPVTLRDPNGAQAKRLHGLDFATLVYRLKVAAEAQDRPKITPAQHDKLRQAQAAAAKAAEGLRAKATRAVTKKIVAEGQLSFQQVSQLGGAGKTTAETLRNVALGSSYGFFEAQPPIKAPLEAVGLLPEQPPEELAGDPAFEIARGATRTGTEVALIAQGAGKEGRPSALTTTTGSVVVLSAEATAVAATAVGVIGVGVQIALSAGSGGRGDEPEEPVERFAEAKLSGTGKHGLKWREGPSRAIKEGKPQGQFQSQADIDWVVEQAKKVQPGQTTVAKLPEGHKSIVHLVEGGTAPATHAFIKVFQSGKVHAYPLRQ
jgi:RHS repeat-associated protein